MTELEAGAVGRARRRLTSLARRGARGVRHRTPVRRLFRPAVSIILPVYDVEAYLPECLDSIAAQSFGDYEVVVVDDGSPDGSRAIVERYAASDQRIRLVVRENGGLGAARNTGVTHARGRYLTFVDSDDVLPPGALHDLVSSARRTGSDIVVGSVLRFDKGRTWRPEWVADVHRERREGVRAEEFLPVLRNLYTWNKLFRRDFYLAQGLSFREGVHYEDQPIITQLYARARQIDVLPDVVYHYRVREDASSISQQTASLRDLQERVEAWEVSRDVLTREASTTLYHGWLATLFTAHFHWYLNSPGTIDDAYWDTLQRAVAELSADAPPELWRATPPDKRVLIELTRQNRRADAQELVRVKANKLDRWPSTVRADGVLMHLPLLGDPGLDEELFLIRPEQLRIAHSVENIHWREQGEGRAVCGISGWAYIRKVDLAERRPTVALLLRGPDGAVHRFESQGPAEPAFPPPVDDTWCDYTAGTFSVELPLHEVMAGARHGESWDVLVEVSVAGFTVVEAVSSLLRSGSAGVVPAADLGNGDRVVADWMHGSPLRFRLDPLALEAVDVGLEGRTISGRLTGPLAGQVDRVVVSSGGVEVSTRVTGRDQDDRRFEIAVPERPAPSTSVPTAWNVAGLTPAGAPTAITLRGSMGMSAWAESGTGALVVERNRNSQLSLSDWSLGVVAEALEVTEDGVVRVAGRAFGSRVSTVALGTTHKKTRAHGEPAPVRDGRFDAELRLRHDVFRFGAQPLPVGDHDFFVVVRLDGADEPVEVPLKMSAQLNGSLPIAVNTEHYEGRLVRGPATGVRLTLVRPIHDARGRYHQNRLRLQPASGRVERGVLMRSYFGEHATDNGLSIQRELERRGSDLPVYWAVQDHSVPVPDGGIPVIVNSREYYQLLSSVTYYIDNMYQPEYHTKPDHQVVVQTFHGYPFKQMGHPHWRNLQFSRAKISSYDARAAEWDYLVSPARYATPLLVRDFAYDGEVLEIGYPRNDVLQSPDAGSIRELTRRSLGIDDHQTAVLYAPTFRDYLSADDSSAAMASFFDFAEAHRGLGDDFVILVRGHAFNARANERVGRLPGTVDVTDYPEVSDLYLAADAAIVDYSSLRFDFGVTGKPMVFHVPDLQRYKETRGWIFDFEPTAPGPLVETTAEVVAELLDLDGVAERHRGEYARFRSEYLDLEDGKAGSRFVDRVFVPRGDA